MQNVQLEGKKSIGKYNAVKSCAHKDKKFKENFDTKYDILSGNLRERCHSTILAVCEKDF